MLFCGLICGLLCRLLCWLFCEDAFRAALQAAVRSVLLAVLQAVLWMAVKHQDKRAIQVCDVCEATSERIQQHAGTVRKTGIWDVAIQGVSKKSEFSENQLWPI